MMNFGWAGREWEEKAYSESKPEFRAFQMANTDKTEEYLWRYVQRLNGGKNIAPLEQLTGDCVANAAARAIYYLTAVSICEYGDRYELKEAFRPYIYGVSRTAKDCGAGQLGRSAGSVGAWAIQAMTNHGVLFDDDPEVPAYSKQVAESWGYRGVEQKYYDLAKDNPLESASKINSIEELRNALLNKHPVIIGSDWGFKVVEKDGHLVYWPSGRWGHEMVFLGWHDKPFPGAFRQNSWGMIDIKPSLNGEPDGGAWCRADHLEKEINAGAELYSLNSFVGDNNNRKYSFV